VLHVIDQELKKDISTVLGYNLCPEVSMIC